MSVSVTAVSDPWTSLKLFPESIPHLLHWDLAYLWLLERPPEVRPPEWRERCDAWRRLLAHFLLGHLQVERTAIREPFVRYTEPYGIREVAKLFYNGVLAGVLSPVVLVRPLPDSEPRLPQLPEIASEQSAEWRYILGVLVKDLRELAALEGERPLERDLLAIVERMASSNPPASGEGTSVRWEVRHETAAFLRKLSFDPDQKTKELDERQISISTGRPIRLFVPLCAQCGRSLARESALEGALDAAGPVMELTCPNRHPNQLQLDKLFIWVRDEDRTSAVCWTDREGSFHTLETPGQAEFPPHFTLSGNEVTFKWNGAEMPGGDGQRIWLKLRFPDGIRTASVFKDAFYTRLLVPGGDPPAFNGLPVRHAWSSAWVSHSGMSVSADAIWYHGVQIAGLPFRFKHLCVRGNMDLQPQLAAAIYPKPMHAGWHRYRVMALGAAGHEARVSAAGGRPLLPNLIETDAWPATVSVERGFPQGSSSGATWKTSADFPVRNPETGARPRLLLGIDFGTTNTVVYFQEEDRASLLNSRHNGLSMRDFPRLIHWIGPTGPQDLSGWFLPHPEKNQDEYLLPSALWRTPGGSCFIRWNADAPAPGCVMKWGFKWDSGMVSQRDLRETYLKELLFYVLPVILENLNGRGTTPALDIGFAYPLAFDYAKRRDFGDMTQSLCRWLQGTCGLESSPYTVNESLASVRAHGAFNPDDLFLVADLGGRTLDVALFSYRSNPREQTDPRYMHQIGSIEFGGEEFLKSVVQHNAGGATDEEQAYWNLRDLIASGAVALHANQDGRMRVLLDRFQPMALEFVRVLLAAFRETHSSGPKNIRVLLVGNGWRLRELTAGGRDPAALFREYFGDALRAFGMDRVELGDTAVQGIMNSKHWVACGALYAAKDPPPLDRQESESLTRLPSGLSFRVGNESLHWSALLGDGGWSSGNPGLVTTQSMEFERDSGPAPGPAWADFIRDCFSDSDRLPTDAMLRQAMITCFENRRFRKGPLAITIEFHWKDLLCRRR